MRIKCNLGPLPRPLPENTVFSRRSHFVGDVVFRSEILHGLRGAWQSGRVVIDDYITTDRELGIKRTQGNNRRLIHVSVEAQHGQSRNGRIRKRVSLDQPFRKRT